MHLSAAAEVDRAPRQRVGVEPLPRCLLRLLPVFAPWSLVVVGRRICLGAQRVPLAVRVVRAVQERRDRNRGTA